MRRTAGVRPTRPLRIAMIGSRGVPARWGGIERHVEELSALLAERGHDVTVFCRSNYVQDGVPEYRGIRLRHLPTISSKHLDAIVHSALATSAAMASSFDIMHYHALGPGVMGVLPRYLSAAKVVQTIHGLDDQRAKWGRGATAVLRTAGWLSGRIPDATIVVSQDLRRHYQEHHRCQAIYIPNGVVPSAPRPPATALARLGLLPGRYLLFVGRFVPEKAPDLLLRAFRRVAADDRLVLAGNSSFTGDYVQGLRERAAEDPRVVLAGFVYGVELEELYSNAAAFVLPSELEGLPLTLLEAAAAATPVVASSIPPHVEVIGEDGPGHRLVPPGDEAALARALAGVLGNRTRERAGALALRDRVERGYRWPDATATTERVYRWVLDPSGSRPEYGEREPAMRSLHTEKQLFDPPPFGVQTP
jgi:glycosyltransferase involved in cell wall biosynthesis